MKKIMRRSMRRSTKITESDFYKCGVAGLLFEVFWTSLHSLKNKNYKMPAKTSIIMFPIYASAAFLKPISHLIRKMNVVLRGFVYTLFIFATEYATGSFLKKRNMCPWDYSKDKYNINGLVRLDYAPAWFIVGLLFEKLLNPSEIRSH